MSCLHKTISPTVSEAQTEMTDLSSNYKSDTSTNPDPLNIEGLLTEPLLVEPLLVEPVLVEPVLIEPLIKPAEPPKKLDNPKLKKDSGYGTASLSAGRRLSVMRSNSEIKLNVSSVNGDHQAVDYFELFCAQAGYKPPRRLSRCDEFGGSLPCLAKDLSGQTEGGFRPMGATEEGYLPSRKHLNLAYTLSLPPSKGLKRVPSDHGPRGSRGLGLSPCFGGGSGADGATSPLARSPNSPLRSPLRSPCSPSRTGSLKKSRSGKLWSSIKNLLEGCSDPSFALDCTDQLSPPPLQKAPCRSAPHSRSSSVKRRRPRNQELANGIRPRTSSLGSRSSLKRPTTLSIDPKSNPPKALSAQTPDALKRVRNFVITPKGFINRGDSFRSRSATSIFSMGSGGSLEDWRASRTSLTSQGPNTHRVLMIGGSGVGKTTLSQQFVTSDGVNVEHIDEEKCTTTVSIFLDGEESTLDFIDLQYGENHRSFMDIDAYVVMYSAADRATFHAAQDLLYDVRKNLNRSDAIILVANKTDLVRSRQVAPEEGKSSAVTYDCKYLEVSALMNLHVDELLAGTLTQIRLHKKPSGDRDRNNTEDGCRSPMAFIGRFLKRQGTYSRSCDNLLVL